VDHFASFTRGVLLFLVGDWVLMSAFGDDGSLLAGSIFLAVVAVVVWRTARTKWRWAGIGLATGFAVMTLLTGGVCTLFGGSSESAVGGLFYLGISFVLLVVAAILERVQAFKRRKSHSSPQP
jgi:hypothetical protein